MKIKSCLLLILAVLIANIAFIYWHKKTRISLKKTPSTTGIQLAIPPLIITSRPSMRVFTLLVPWIGTVELQNLVELTALVAGRIKDIEIKDQALVKSGTLIARLGGPKIEGQRAKLASEIGSLKIQLDLAQQTVKRLRKNLKLQLVTKDQVAAAQDVQAKLKNQLLEARLNLKIFKRQICISTPIDGIFTNRRISVGQDVTAGQAICEIIDSSHLRITASLFPPKDISLLNKEASIRLDVDQLLTGFVQRILPQSTNTGAMIIWIEGPQIDRQLRVGQTVGGNITIEVKPESLAVPESAVIYDSQERPYVFIKENNIYKPKLVHLGLIQNGWVEILSGLNPDEFVVTQGAYELFYRQFNEQFKEQD